MRRKRIKGPLTARELKQHKRKHGQSSKSDVLFLKVYVQYCREEGGRGEGETNRT